MQESEQRATDPSRCDANSLSGNRCRKRAVRGRFCLVHAGAQNMRELGRKGGLVKQTTPMRANVDDELREQAREVLAKALRGDDVDKDALAAARSLFSYRPSPAPTEAAALDAEAHPPKIVHLVDLIEVGVECGLIKAERGGAILVEGRRVERVHPGIPLSRESAPGPVSGDLPALANNESQAPPGDPFGPNAGDFDESEGAKLRRRYGSEVEGSTWRHA